MNHVVEAQQFSKELLEQLFSLANKLEHGPDHTLKGRLMASLFYEPSTRTRFSFEAAMMRLGGNVLSTENASEFSSSIKGETLEDSVRVISQYVDVIVLRHPEAGASERASKISNVPIINAGDGAGQHPTQALLDLYTIKRELGRIDGMNVAVIGDLKYGRTIRSLAYMLGKYDGVNITFVSPKELSIGDDIKEYLERHNTKYHEVESLSDVLSEADVVYQTRIQKERFFEPKDAERYVGMYRLNKRDAEKMKKSAIIMHPLPRVDEIAVEVDDMKQAAYFRQAYYGLIMRKAVLKFLLNGNGGSVAS